MTLPDDDTVRRWRLNAGVILVAILGVLFGGIGGCLFCSPVGP